MNISILVGVAIAVTSALLAQYVKFERRTFYAALTLVVASYYLLFAVMSGEWRVLVIDSVIALMFASLAIVGFRRNTNFIAAALALHALLDLGHNVLITNSGTPVWWPAFCLSFDLTAALLLAWQLMHANKQSLNSFRKQ